MQGKITKRTVDAATATSSDLWVWDTEVKGFGLRVKPNGRKVYIVEYRPGPGGRSAPKRRFTIGQHGSPWTPDRARTEAIRLLGQVKDGQDPAAERTAKRGKGDTVAEVAKRYIEAQKIKGLRSWPETERVFGKDINPALGSKRLDAVARSDITKLRDSVAKRGPIMSNRTLAYMRGFFNWCVDEGLLTTSPCKGVKPVAKAEERDRTLDDDELAEVWRAVEVVGEPWASIIKLLVLTAQRREEVAGMERKELDLKARTWTIPAARAKNKRTHEVPLTDTAIAIIEGVGERAASPFVFTTTGTTPVSGFSKAKEAIDKQIAEARLAADPEASAMPDWVMHDLRRTATTGMARLGIPPHVADAVLNHKQGTIKGVAAVYNRHAYMEERRRAFEAWEDHVLSTVAAMAKADNVIAFHAAMAKS